MDDGDKRYVVLFESSYRQAQASFASLETVLRDPDQHKNLSELKTAAEKYHQGFQIIHTDHIEVKEVLESN